MADPLPGCTVACLGRREWARTTPFPSPSAALAWSCVAQLMKAQIAQDARGETVKFSGSTAVVAIICSAGPGPVSSGAFSERHLWVND